MSTELNILFISRAYPPVIGGIEKQNFELNQALGEIASVELIANTRGKAFLPIFFLTALFRGLLLASRSDVILLGDGVLAPLGWALKLLTRKPVCSIIHGLDITYANKVYQALWVRFCLSRLDRLFAVGNETIAQAVSRGIDQSKCCFIPNGVKIEGNITAAHGEESRIVLEEGMFHVLTLGRLVERKGVPWFVEHVFSSLPENVNYWIAGDGPCRQEIELAVSRLAEPGRVTVLGVVSPEEKQALLTGTDLFVQPNVPVEGDMEGFGLVVLEAAAAGLPVLASRLEGLCDAVVEGKNGVLVEALNAQAWTEKVGEFAASPETAASFGEQAREYVVKNCQWSAIAPVYVKELAGLVSR